jgi:hypothetical protein
MEKCDTQQNNEKSDTQHYIMPSGITPSAIMLNVVAPKIAILGFKHAFGFSLSHPGPKHRQGIELDCTGLSQNGQIQ